MAIMIPDVLSPEIKSTAEKRVFQWFKDAPGTEDWIVLHSLGLAVHKRFLHGEVDFLVLAPGMGIFALEVKGGRVRRNMGRWRFINKYGEYTEKARGPFDQAWEGIYSVKSSVASRLDFNHGYIDQINYGIGVMFPDILYSSVGVDEEPWQVFDIEDGKNVRDYVRRLSDRFSAKRKQLGYNASKIHYPTTGDVKYLANLLRGDFDRDVPLKIRQKYSEESMLSLTKEQALCVEQLTDNPRVMILGTAGTGKTLLAVEAVKRSVLSGESTAFFCYNRLLAEWVGTVFSELPENIRPRYAGTFHKYMTNLLGQCNVSEDEKSDEGYEDYYRDTLPRLLVRHRGEIFSQFDRIIIDEAQDLINAPYMDVMELCLRDGLARGKWTLFGDFTAQAIYNGSLSETQYLDMLGNRAFFATFRLRLNCRNTDKICMEIGNVAGVEEKPAFEKQMNSPPVQYLYYTDMDEQKERLIRVLQELQDNNISPKDIVILSPRKREDSVVGTLNGITIRNYTPDGAGEIRFSTVQGFKGLESAFIILVDIEDYNNDKLMYVALSRARFVLYVLETSEAKDQRCRLFFNRSLKDGR